MTGLSTHIHFNVASFNVALGKSHPQISRVMATIPVQLIHTHTHAQLLEHLCKLWDQKVAITRS